VRDWRTRLELEARSAFPDLPPLHTIGEAARSPWAYLDRLAANAPVAGGNPVAGSDPVPGGDPAGGDGPVVGRPVSGDDPVIRRPSAVAGAVTESADPSMN
jgi:hypothetical protein